MKLTTIDIGTNTILMLIGEVGSSSGQINTLFDTLRIPRLGKGVDSNKNISDESTQKAVDILNEYKKISNENGSNKIIATATCFLRDAHNKNDFINKIREETGIKIEILTGEDEARWSFLGGVYEQLTASDSKLQICTIDIGGGSTEITTVRNTDINITEENLLELPIESCSINIGSVRIKEKFFFEHPPNPDRVNEAQKFINDELNKINISLKNTKPVGVAGTITTLAALKKGLKEFNREEIEGMELSKEDIDKLVTHFCTSSLEDLYNEGTYMQGRADIILPGTLILKSFMGKYDFEKITVSTKGLRYGILLREAIVQ
jgi:exopolyphosphatase/guanosine-5'-triphosphate,3'-diphosphate pyrophosphatase